MRWITIIRRAAVALLFGAIAFSAPAQDQSNQSSDDVAAAARKAREQQKNAQKPAKVVTNDDIPHFERNFRPVRRETVAGTGGMLQV